MESFALKTEFNSWQEVLQAKKVYEENSKTLLSITKSDKLKGVNELNERLIYERVTFECKAGTERRTKSEGHRKSSTYKKNCPVKVRLAFEGNKLVVRESKLNHQNHNCDQQTYDHYPENVRLTGDDLVTAKQMIEVDANKKKVKMFLTNKTGKPVLMKSLHNIQTNNQIEKQGAPGNELLKLYDLLAAIPNAKSCFVTDEDDELVGIYYQDERMLHIYSKFPELILYDATYKLNNRDMPLFTQCVVDGNGLTEVASLFICQSESRDGIGAMLDIFKNFNKDWDKTIVIIGDKDFADRAVYSEKFPQAVLQICLYHVLTTFHREISTTKREISSTQRAAALEVIQRIVYSQSDEVYQSTYQELCDLKLDLVTKYFNDNWHSIKEEWTLHGRNGYANYMNSTNNRSERLNRTFKQIGNRHANLLKFFENVTTSVSVLASEKDIAAIRSTMRVERQRFDDHVLTEYHQLLTPFIFQKMETQFKLREKVVIVQKECQKIFVTQSGYKVTDVSCTCMFFITMNLPCKHLMKVLEIEKKDLFVPSLCSERWTKNYYQESHPAVGIYDEIQQSQPIHVHGRRIPSEIDKYKKLSKIYKEICNLGSSMSTGQFQYFIEKASHLRDEMIQTDSMDRTATSSLASLTEHSNILRSVASTSTATSFNVDVVSSLASLTENSNILRSVVASTSTATSSNVDVVSSFASLAENSNILPSVASTSTATESNIEKLLPLTQSKFKNDASIIKLPAKLSSIGRPKGSGQTVIGLKRKTDKKSKSEPPAKKKFLDLGPSEQTLTLIEWLTNKPSVEIQKKKIEYGDIIQDSLIFNRLRNDAIDLNGLKKYMEKKCYKYIVEEVQRLNENAYWACAKCKRNLNGVQLMCCKCLDWFHLSCTEYKAAASSKNVTYFCDSCKV